VAVALTLSSLLVNSLSSSSPSPILPPPHQSGSPCPPFPPSTRPRSKNYRREEKKKLRLHHAHPSVRSRYFGFFLRLIAWPETAAISRAGLVSVVWLVLQLQVSNSISISLSRRHLACSKLVAVLTDPRVSRWLGGSQHSSRRGLGLVLCLGWVGGVVTAAGGEVAFLLFDPTDSGFSIGLEIF
jgi:hypothetical protein